MAIKDTLTTVTDGYKTKLDDEMLQRLEIYFKLLVEWNEKMNPHNVLNISEDQSKAEN